MTYLLERFQELRALPRRPLVAPTAVAAMPVLSKMTGASLWVKRDDATSAAYGGNKVRKLEFLLGEAAAADARAMVTIGAYGSHHVLATAVHGAAAGLEVHALLTPQPRHPHVDENLRADLAAGATLHPVASFKRMPFQLAVVMAKLRRQGMRPFFVPHGGSTPTGALGYVEAGLELAAQVDAGLLPEPEVVYVALGSGGTAAGLAVGLAAAGLTTRVVAVRVTDRVFANPLIVGRLVHGAVSKLQALDPRFPAVAEIARGHVEIDNTGFGRGYGVSTPDTRRAVEHAAAEALVMDETYTARALEVMLRHAEERRFAKGLFVHTLSSADLSPLLAQVAKPPSFVERS